MRAGHASGALICAVEMIVFCSSRQLLMQAEHASGALMCAVGMIVFLQLLAAFNASKACSWNIDLCSRKCLFFAALGSS